MATNIGHLFYKQYFNGLKLDRNTGKPKLDNPINQQFYNLKLTDYPNLVKTPYKGSLTIPLTTVYPGLLIGSGYIHEVGGKEIENELKLGFFFDYTTGMPVIPGSSVKGLLRSAFKKDGGDYINELLSELDITITHSISELEKAIFENSDSVSIYKRDIFFDAYPVQSENNNAAFLANDYITHHENPLKDPNPVQFLKILPNVQFQFNFKLTANGGLSADNKLKLFKQILLDLGIGAKTNVGYGQFELGKEEKLKEKKEMAEREQKVLLTELKRKEAEKEASKTEAEKRIVNGAKLQCKVVDMTKTEVFFMFDWDKELKFKKKKARLSEELERGSIIVIEIIDNYYITRRVLFSNTVTIIE